MTSHDILPTWHQVLMEHTQGVPLSTESSISLIILTPMKILQRNLNRSMFFSFTFLTQWGKLASNFVVISSLVVKLLYRVFQEECVKLWESVPYVKVYRYNLKHLYPKMNGYRDNSQRKVGASCCSKYCNPHSWLSRDAAHVLETDSRNEQCAWGYQNAQSAKFYQYFHTAGYTCAMYSAWKP
jgi:hypothetical protein